MSATRPRLADETPALTAVAAHLCTQRVALYPAAIERGAIGEAEAADGIRVMAAIALDWRRRLALCPLVPDPAETPWHRFLTCDLPGLHEASDREKVDTLTSAHARATQLHDRQPPTARDDYADCVAALLWWHQPQGGTGPRSRLDHIIALNRRKAA